MADKKFGVKQIDLIGASGTPNLTSPNNLNLNAVTVAISTDVTIGGQVTSNIIVGTGKSIGIGTTIPTGDLDVRGQTNLSNVNVSGVSTFAGITTVSGTTFTNQLSVSGVSTFRSNVDIYNGTLSLKTPTDENVFSISYDSGNDDVSFYFQQTGGTGGSQVKYLLLNNAEFYITNASTGGGIAKFVANGANELYYVGSKKFETIGAGVTVTGTNFTNQLSVSGVTTIGSAVTSATLLRVSGIATFREIRVGTTSLTAYVNDDYSNTLSLGNVLYVYNVSESGSVYNLIDSQNRNTFIGISTATGAPNYMVGILTATPFNPDVDTNNHRVALGYGNDPYVLETTGFGVTVAGTIKTNQLSVSGVSTFNGTTNTNQLSVSGVSTFTNTINLNAGNLKVADNGIIKVGSSDQFEIYYNGGEGQVIKSTSDLLLKQSRLLVNNAANTENMLIANQNGSVELYYDNSKKFETLGAGVTVTGTTNTNQLSVSGVTTFGPGLAGDEGDVDFKHNGATRAYWDGSAGTLKFKDGSGVSFGTNDITTVYSSAGQLTFGQNLGSIKFTKTSGSENIAAFNVDGSVELYYDNSKKFETIGAGVTVTGTNFTNQLSVSGFSTFIGNVRFANSAGVSTYVHNIGPSYIIGYDTSAGYPNDAYLYFSPVTSNYILKSVGIGTTNPGYYIDGDIFSGATLNNTNLTVGAVGASGTVFLANGKTIIDGMNFHSGIDGAVYNVYLGYLSGLKATAGGSNNVAVGPYALEDITSASNNTAIGAQTLKNITSTGNSNTAVGALSGDLVTTGDQNTFVGSLSGSSVISASNNTFVGYSAGNSTSSSNNTFLGCTAGTTITTGSNNTIVGGYDGISGLDIRTSSNNVVLSDGAGNIKLIGNPRGVGIGTTNPVSGYDLTLGNDSSLGRVSNSLKVHGYGDINGLIIKGNSTTGTSPYYTDNVVITQHPASTFTGGRNVAIGDYSFTTPGAAGENVALGYYALSIVGNNNTTSTYNGNTAVGCWAGQNCTTTLYNTFIGWSAGRNITTGGYNVILGGYDGNSGGLDIRTSSNNVVLSDGAGNIRLYANSSGNIGIGTTNPTSALEVRGTIKDSIGNVRSIPQNAQTSAYILAVTDVGKHVAITTGGITLPSSTFSAGDNLTIFNNSDNNQMITPSGGVTLRRAGVGDTGARGLNGYGLATILCIGSNSFVITGAGLT